MAELAAEFHAAVEAQRTCEAEELITRFSPRLVAILSNRYGFECEEVERLARETLSHFAESFPRQACDALLNAAVDAHGKERVTDDIFQVSDFLSGAPSLLPFLLDTPLRELNTRSAVVLSALTLRGPSIIGDLVRIGASNPVPVEEALEYLIPALGPATIDKLLPAVAGESTNEALFALRVLEGVVSNTWDPRMSQIVDAKSFERRLKMLDVTRSLSIASRSPSGEVSKAARLALEALAAAGVRGSPGSRRNFNL